MRAVNANERIAAHADRMARGAPAPLADRQYRPGNGPATRKNRRNPAPSCKTPLPAHLADVHHPAGAVQQLLQLAVLVLLAVVLSTTGVLIGMMVMAAALLDHHDRHRDRGAGRDRGEQQHRSDRHLSGVLAAICPGSKRSFAPPKARIRPVLLTTITTMAGLAPMMFGHQPRLLWRWLHHRQPHRAVVETAGHRRGLWPWHCHRADTGGHPRRCWRSGSGPSTYIGSPWRRGMARLPLACAGPAGLPSDMAAAPQSPPAAFDARNRLDRSG